MRVSIALIFIASIFLGSCTLWSKAKTGLWFVKAANKDSTSFSKVLKSKDYDYQLRMADRYYVKKDYNHAQQLFEELFPILKGGPQFEDLYYKFAFCSFYLKDYANAENLFKGFVEVFPKQYQG